MKPYIKYIRDILITLTSLAAAFVLSLVFQRTNVEEHITTAFVFAVFIISFFTEGYFYGVAAAFVGTLAVNYAFTFPYFAIDFMVRVNFISAVIMVTVAVLTSALTTKLKHHEAQKDETEREHMRANLLRAVSHDLRTPLTTIYGSATTLIERSDIMTDEQKTKIAEGIKEDSQWLIRMVENLLSVTRIDNGHIRIDKTPTVLEELIDAVVLKFKKRYAGQKIELELPEEVIIIAVDAILMEQVIGNILENAVQHAKGMTRLVLRVFTLGKQVIFEIEDDGYGISQRRLENIFKGVSNSEDELADGRKKNTGIGLSVCATIIKAHGGIIYAENLKTGGTVFRFMLDME